MAKDSLAHNALNRVIPFEYSAKLAAALELHGIDDPHTAWTVFSARAEALQTCTLGFRSRVSAYLPRVQP